jgi:uncharacterized protein YegJ (DUF2314 family)
MASEDEALVPVCIPALSAVLLHAEDQKGKPLSYDEVIRIRDASPCMMMRAADARKMAESRGYQDIDPENCWYDFQNLRRELGRKPDLDPGPKFNQVRSADPEYQKTILDAHASLDYFRNMLPDDGSPRWMAMVKTEVVEGDQRAFLWLANARKQGPNFIAEFFEVPAAFRKIRVGEECEVSAESLLDWMLNDAGVLHGGFSIRYQRAKLPEVERDAYDKYIGVMKYA